MYTVLVDLPVPTMPETLGRAWLFVVVRLQYLPMPSLPCPWVMFNLTGLN